MSELGRFQEVESELENRLLEVRLIFELGLSKEEHEELKATLRAVTRQWGGPAAVGRFYPAIYATSLTFTGLYELHAGELWDRVPPLIRDNVPERGPAFVKALDALGLETFQSIVDREPTQQYVMRILAHGGVPHAYVDKFGHLLVEEIERGRTDPNTLLTEWNVNRARLEHLQKATQRFLLDGGEPAVDFLARCLAVLEEGIRTGSFPSADLAGLSEPVVDGLRNAAQADTSKGRNTAGVAPPRLELDPYGDLGPRLVLPAIMGSQRGRWMVDSGEDLPVRHDGTGLRDTIVPVPPADTYRVSYDTGGAGLTTWEFSGPGSGEMLAFSPETDQQVPYHGALAVNEAYLVVQRETKVEVEGSDLNPDTPREHGTLPELTGDWSDWKQLHVNLKNVDRLVLTSSTGRLTLPVVAPRARPEIESGPVDAVTDEAGNPVYSQAPRVRLPQGNGRGTWRVRLIDPDGLELPFEVPATTATIDLAMHSDPETFGSYRLTIQGPLGSDMRAAFTVAPGLVVERPDQVWLPSHGTPKVEVFSDASINGAPAGELVLIDFTDDSANAELLLEPNAGKPVNLRVHVDRLLWTVSHATKPIVPQNAHPLRIGREEFEDALEDLVLLSTGRRGVEVCLELWEDEVVSQRSKTATTMGEEGRWKFDLAPFSDQIRQSQAASLELRLSVEGKTVRLASIVAKTVPTAVTARRNMDGQVIVTFEKTREVAGIEARLWSLSRPWDGPAIATVDESGNAARLDPTIAPGGYLFELDVPDDWSEPKRPDPIEGEVLEFQIDGDDEYRQHLDDLDPGDPGAVLERVLAGWRGKATIGAAAGTDTLERVYCPAGLVCEEILKQSVPDAAVSKLDSIIDLFWESDTSLARWFVVASEAGAIREEALTHLSLRIIARPEESSAKWDPIDPDLMERLWRFAPVVAAFFDVPYARTDDETRSRCREYLGWVPGVDPDRGGGQLTVEDLEGERRGHSAGTTARTAPGADQRDFESTPELRGLMSRDNLRRATYEWLQRLEDREKDEWLQREGDLAKRLDLLNYGGRFQKKLWRGLNSRRFPRGMGVDVESWMDLPAIIMSDALSAAGLMDQNDRRDRRALSKLHQAVSTARRLVEHDLILVIILRSQ